MMLKHLKQKGGLVALALAATLLPACTTGEPTAEAPTTEVPEATSEDPVNVTTEEVAGNTEELIGKTVTVRSEPGEKVGSDAFTIENEQFFGTEPILVINASGEPIALPEDADNEIQVTGEVQQLVLADVKRDYGLDLDQSLYVDYENKPAIIAQSIAPAPEPGEITNNPEQYYNKPIAVTGEIEDVQSASVFSLDEEQLFGSEDLLVVNLNADVKPVDGETVAVTGVVRPFVVADLERDYDLGWDLEVQQKLEAEYSNRPVLVADDIYPSAIPD